MRAHAHFDFFFFFVFRQICKKKRKERRSIREYRKYDVVRPDNIIKGNRTDESDLSGKYSIDRLSLCRAST